MSDGSLSCHQHRTRPPPPLAPSPYTVSGKRQIGGLSSGRSNCLTLRIMRTKTPMKTISHHMEDDEELHRIADERWAVLQRTGKSIAWADAKTYFRARAAGIKTPLHRPDVRKPET